MVWKDVLAELSVIVTSDTSSVQQSLKNASTSVDKLGNNVTTLGAIGASVFTAMSFAVGNFVTQSVNEFSKLDKAVREVGSILHITETDISSLKNQMTELSKATGQTAVGLTEALYEIVSAGPSLQEALEILPVAVQAAIGGVTTVETAADALTTVINAYGYAASDATKISDIFFTTVAIGKATMESLASGIGVVATNAATLGLSFEELSASIAVATQSGVATQRAMTYAKGALQALTSPTADVKKIFDSLGLTFTDNEGKFIGFEKSLGMVNASLITLVQQGMSLPEAWKAIFPSVEARTLMMILTNQAEKYTEALNGIEAASGSTAYANEAMAESFDTKKAKVMATYTEVLVDLGERMAPTLLEIGNLITGILDSFEELPGPMKSVLATGLLMVGVMGIAMSPLLSISQIVLSLIPALGLLALKHSTVAAAAATEAASNTALAGTNAILTVSFGALTKSIIMFLATNPVGWALIAIGAIAAVSMSLGLFDNKLSKVTDAEIELSNATAALTTAKANLSSQLNAVANAEVYLENKSTALKQAVDKYGESSMEATSAELERIQALKELSDQQAKYTELFDATLEALDEKIEATKKLAEAEKVYAEESINEIYAMIAANKALRKDNSETYQKLESLKAEYATKSSYYTNLELQAYAEELVAIQNQADAVDDLKRQRDEELRSKEQNTALITQLNYRITDSEKEHVNMLIELEKDMDQYNDAQKQTIYLLAEQYYKEKRWTTAQEAASDAMDDYTTATNNAIKATQDLQDARDSLSDANWNLEEAELDLADAQDTLYERQQDLKDVVKEYGSGSREAKAAERDVTRAERRITELQQSYNDLLEERNKLEADDSTAGSIKNLEKVAKSADDVATEAKQKLDDLSDSQSNYIDSVALTGQAYVDATQQVQDFVVAQEKAIYGNQNIQTPWWVDLVNNINNATGNGLTDFAQGWVDARKTEMGTFSGLQTLLTGVTIENINVNSAEEIGPAVKSATTVVSQDMKQIRNRKGITG